MNEATHKGELDLSSLDGILTEMEAVCAPALPGYRIRLHLLDCPHWVPPFVVFDDDGAMDRIAQENKGVVVGTRVIGKTGPEFPTADIFVIPLPHWQIAGGKVEGDGNALRGRNARIMFKLSPFLFEFSKYLTEWKWRRRPHAGRWLKPADIVQEGVSSAKELPQPGGSSAGAPERPRPAILIALHWFEHGGAEKLAFDTIRWALEAKLRVFVIAEHDAPHRLLDTFQDSPDLAFLRSDRYLPRQLLPAFLLDLAARENIRLVHLHHHSDAYTALPALRAAFPDIQVIDSTHIIEYRDGGYVAMAGDWSRYVDYHHVISHALARMLRTRYGADDKIMLGRLLQRGQDSQPASMFSLSPAEERITVAFVGRMSHQKRPILVAMISRELSHWARQSGVEIGFEFVGEGPYLEAMKTLIERYGIADQCRFHLANANVPSIMGAADILLLPSANEGLALVCYEAVRHGTIPISTDVGAQSELLPPELLVAPNPIGISRRVRQIVERLWNDPDFRAAAEDSLTRRMTAIAGEPTAREVLMPIYEAQAEIEI